MSGSGFGQNREEIGTWSNTQLKKTVMQNYTNHIIMMNDTNL